MNDDRDIGPIKQHHLEAHDREVWSAGFIGGVIVCVIIAALAAFIFLVHPRSFEIHKDVIEIT